MTEIRIRGSAALGSINSNPESRRAFNKKDLIERHRAAERLFRFDSETEIYVTADVVVRGKSEAGRVTMFKVAHPEEQNGTPQIVRLTHPASGAYVVCVVDRVHEIVVRARKR